MNPPDEPLSDRDLDELLSADLDGELQRAAADLGVPLAAARDAIATPEASTRRAALAGTRRLVADPVDLDPVATDRLVANAISRGRDTSELEAARRRRERRADTARRVMVGAGSAAALVAVIIGLAHMSGPTGGAKSSAPSVESSSSKGAGGPTGNVTFGDVSNRDALRRRVEARLGLPAPRPLGQSGGPAARSFDTVKPDAEKADGTTDATATAVRQKLATCTAVARRAAAARAAPVLRGSGVSDRRPVYVLVFRRGAVYDVVVVDRSSCTVVARTSVP